jgi:S-layer protein
MAVAQDYVGVVQQLYISYFGRPADYFGLKNFTEQLAALNAPTDYTALNAAAQASKTSPLAILVNSFNASSESAALYGTDTSQVGVSKFIEAIYLNVLGRAPDVEGWAFWTAAVTSGSVTRANAALAITEGALHNTTAQGLLDATTVSNKLTVATNFTAALDTVAEINGYSGDTAAATARGLLTGVNSTTNPTAYQATVEAAVAAVVSGSIPSTTTALTTAVETVVGANGNDIFNGTMHATEVAADTLNALDSIDGGAGNDTLNILALDTITGLHAGTTIKNVENLIFRGAGGIGFIQANETGVTGVTKVGVTQATTVTLDVAGTTAVEIAGASGAIAVDGGSSESVTATGAAGITLGATTVAKGAITVSATAQAAGAVAIDGGTSVSVTTAGVTTGTLDIGQGGAATDLASGAVAVNATGAAAVAGASVTLGAITIDGGSKVTVIEKATSDDSASATDGAAGVITQSDVTITGGTTTTEVTVAQTAAADAVNYVAAVAGKKSVDVVTFVAAAAGETIVVNGLTFTAAKALTAAQVAAAFANLAAGATQGSAAAGDGIYSGTFNTLAYTSGAVTGNTVTLTGKTNAATAIATVSDTAAAGNVSVTHTVGNAATALTAGELGVAGGTVVVADSGSKTLATVSLSGYGATSTVTSDALATLNLANSDELVTVANTVVTTLALNVDNLGANATGSVDVGATYTTVNLAVASDSTFSLLGADVTALNVSGAGAADLTASTLAALKTVKVTGAAGLTIDASGATVTSVDTTGTTGDATVKLNAVNATYTGGAGVDDVTLSAAAPVKAVSLGAGDDSLTLAAGTTTSTAVLNGGDGTDTLVMDAADAASASLTTGFATKITGFEKLSLHVAATDVVDMANLDNINYVISAGNTTSLELDNFAANGTLELTATGVLTKVVLADATGTADVLNVVTKVGLADVNVGIVNAAGVESINLTATDTTTKVATNLSTIELNGAALKAVTVTGNANVTLVSDSGNVALKSIDGSALTGALTADSGAVASVTIKGGAGDDVLTASSNAATLIGGAGADTLIVAGNLATLTGGAGNDTFNVASPTTNVNSYATITDLTAGDIIKFTATAATFNSSKVSLADTAVFQDYANAAVAATDTGDVSWFQIGGNTYVIDNVSDGTTFTNGTDVIVKITGLVDLTNASFTSTGHTLVLLG